MISLQQKNLESQVKKEEEEEKDFRRVEEEVVRAKIGEKTKEDIKKLENVSVKVSVKDLLSLQMKILQLVQQNQKKTIEENQNQIMEIIDSLDAIQQKFNEKIKPVKHIQTNNGNCVDQKQLTQIINFVLSPEVHGDHCSYSIAQRAAESVASAVFKYLQEQ